MNQTGPGGIIPGSYDASKLSQDQRNWLFNYFGNQGTAPVGYGGQHVSGDYGTNYVNNNGTYGPDQSAISQAVQTQNTQNENNFISGFQGVVNNLPSVTQTYNTLASTLGITPTQQALTTAENNLNAVPQQTRNLATSMGGISADQMAERTAVKQGEQAPLVQSLANTLGIQNQNLGTLFQGQEQANQNALLPWETQANFVGQAASQAVSMWSQTDQEQFQQLMTKIQSDQQLSEQEALMANEYAQKLQQYTSNPGAYSAINYSPSLYNLMASSIGATGGTGSTGSTGSPAYSATNPLGLF